MTTLTAPRRTTVHRPGAPVLLISILVIAALVMGAALTIQRLMSTPTVTHPAQTVSYTSGGGNESHHQVRGNAGVHAAAAVAYQRQYLQQLLNQQTRLTDEGTPKDEAELNALAVKVTAAQKALATALAAQKALQTH